MLDTILYPDFPKYYVWNKSQKIWTNRVRKGKSNIGRIYIVNPSEGEKYYLRMLLYHVSGATSFKELRSFNGIDQLTFKNTAIKYKI